jgi:hypothetical protein
MIQINIILLVVGGHEHGEVIRGYLRTKGDWASNGAARTCETCVVPRLLTTSHAGTWILVTPSGLRAPGLGMDGGGGIKYRVTPHQGF